MREACCRTWPACAANAEAGGCAMTTMASMRKRRIMNIAFAAHHGRGEYNFYLYCYDKQAQREHREHREQSEPASPAPIRKHNKQEMER